jgi:hypothetical protein
MSPRVANTAVHRSGRLVSRLNERVTMRLDPPLGGRRLATGELSIRVRSCLRVAVSPGTEVADDADLSLLGGHPGLVRRTQPYVFTRITTKGGREIIGTVANRSRVAASPQPRDVYLEQV